MVLWRAVGLNYVRYSQIAAEVTGKCLKGAKDTRKAAQTLRMANWESGKQVAKK